MIKRNENLNLLSLQFIDQNFDENNLIHLNLLNQLSIQNIITNNGDLPAIPPFEKHPYIEDLIPNDKISGLMIGTFPPISYLCSSLNLASLNYEDQRFTSPDLDYFHGNYSSLWKYAPINFENITLQPRESQPVLIRNEINNSGIEYTDIIKYTQRCLNKHGKYDAGDKNLESIVLNNQIFDYLFQSNSINRLYFTNASFFGSNNRSNHLFDLRGNYILDYRDSFRLFLKGAMENQCVIEIARNEEPESWHNISEGIRDNNVRKYLNILFTTKIILKLRLTKDGNSKVFNIYSAVSPAAVNRGKVRKNKCVIRYKDIMGLNIEDAPSQLLQIVLLSFFNNTIDNLLEYNIS